MPLTVEEIRRMDIEKIKIDSRLMMAAAVPKSPKRIDTPMAEVSSTDMSSFFRIKERIPFKKYGT